MMKKEEFDLHAQIEDVHWWFKARREILLDVLKKYVPVNREITIAEIGCGTGGNLKYLQEFYNVVGSDISPEAVAYARKRLPCDILLGDFHKLFDAKGNDVDAVILADVLEHIADDATFLKELVERLRPHTYLLISVPAHRLLWSGHDVALRHQRRYSRGELRALWKGCEVDEMYFSAFNCVLFPLISAVRILLRRYSESERSDLRLPAPWLNSLLYRIFSVDRLMLKFTPLACGTSYLALLRKR